MLYFTEFAASIDKSWMYSSYLAITGIRSMGAPGAGAPMKFLSRTRQSNLVRFPQSLVQI